MRSITGSVKGSVSLILILYIYIYVSCKAACVFTIKPRAYVQDLEYILKVTMYTMFFCSVQHIVKYRFIQTCGHNLSLELICERNPLMQGIHFMFMLTYSITAM